MVIRRVRGGFSGIGGEFSGVLMRCRGHRTRLVRKTGVVVLCVRSYWELVQLRFLACHLSSFVLLCYERALSFTGFA